MVGRKRLCCLALVLALGIPAGSAYGAKKQITFTFWGQPPVMKGYEQARQEFQKLHPDIVVKLQQPSGGYYDKVTTMFVSGNGPDVAWYECNEGPSMSWIANGIFMPVDSYIKSSNLDVNTLFHPIMMNAQKYDGKTFGRRGSIYGLPKGWNTDGLWYNKDMFDRAGLSYPNGKWSWNDLVQAGRKLTQKSGNGQLTQIGLGTEGTAWNFILQAGGNMTDDDGKVTIDSPAVIEGLQFWADLSLKHQIAPYPGAKGLPAGWADSWMIKNRAAMGICAAWFATPFVKEKNPERFGVAPLPNGRYNNGILYTGGVGISKKSKYKNEAWEWVKFISLNLKANIEHGMSFDEWPPLMAACKSQEMITPPTLRFDRSALITQLNNSTLRPAPPKHAKRVEDLYQPVFDQVKAGKRDAATALPPLGAQIRTIVAGK